MQEVGYNSNRQAEEERTTDKAATPEGKYLASAKLGPEGQIVVPKEVREMFGARPGDTLLLADVNRGIAL